VARYNYQLVKTHRAYAVDELADLLKIHKHTVNNWIKEGLEVCSTTRPRLMRGSDIRDFLYQRKNRNKKTCQPGEIYCVSCKKPRTSKDGFAMLARDTALVGNLIGECPVCSKTMHRKVALRKIDVWSGNLTLTEVEG